MGYELVAAAVEISCSSIFQMLAFSGPSVYNYGKQFAKLEFDGGKEMFEELGISFGTALIVLIALYFVVKWAVKNGIKEAYKDITVKDTAEDIEAEEICNELGLNEEEK